MAIKVEDTDLFGGALRDAAHARKAYKVAPTDRDGQAARRHHMAGGAGNPVKRLFDIGGDREHIACVP